MLKPIVISREVKIHVSRKEIDTGVFGNAKTCAIAKAVKAKLGDHPEVDGNTIEVNLKCGVSAVYGLPLVAADFIRAFDNIKDDHYDRSDQRTARKALKPFTFVAELLEAHWES